LICHAPKSKQEAIYDHGIHGNPGSPMSLHTWINYFFILSFLLSFGSNKGCRYKPFKINVITNIPCNLFSYLIKKKKGDHQREKENVKRKKKKER
jgi:hypothetical protein